MNWLFFFFFFKLQEVSIEGTNSCFIFLFGSSSFREGGKRLNPVGAAVLVMFQFLETEGDQESTEVVEVVNLDWD